MSQHIKGIRRGRAVGLYSDDEDWTPYDDGRRRPARPKSLTGNRCCYCGVALTKGDGRSWDDDGNDREVAEHVIPRALGGRHTVPACQACNGSKGRLLLAEWVARLLVKRGLGTLKHREHIVIERALEGAFETGWLEGYFDKELLASALEANSRKIREKARAMQQAVNQMLAEADVLLHMADAVDAGEL